MRRSRVILAGALATATLAAGAGTAYAVQSASVTITVDGKRQHVRTFADTVAGALDSAHVRVGSHDLVVPAADTSLHRGSRITVRHARQLALTIDGVQRNVWVLADSVGEALDELGLATAGAVVSASRSSRLPLSGFDLAVRLPHSVTVLADGTARRVVTTDPTVAALLTRLHIALARTDRVSVPLSTYPADGATVRVTRIRTKTITETAAVAFRTVRKADASLTKGRSRTETAGRAGALARTYLATFVDGKLTSKRLVSQRQTAAPRTAVVFYGTKPAPKKPAATSFSGGGGSFGGLNWAALARCESGGNPRAISPGGSYRGLYQFSISTWHSVGGSGDPINASPSEQTHRAWVLYQRSGRGPWPVCGRYL